MLFIVNEHALFSAMASKFNQQSSVDSFSTLSPLDLRSTCPFVQDMWLIDSARSSK